jgi:hypothetical protein
MNIYDREQSIFDSEPENMSLQAGEKTENKSYSD